MRGIDINYFLKRKYAQTEGIFTSSASCSSHSSMNGIRRHREPFPVFDFFLFGVSLISQPSRLNGAAIVEMLELSPSLMSAVMVYYAKQFVDIMSSTTIGDV
jgi:hypothetical protein